MLRARLILLCLLALVSTGPVHDWLHGGQGRISFDGLQLHGSDCHHFPGLATHPDDCGLCVASRVSVALPGAGLDARVATRTVIIPAVDDPRVVWSWARRVLGARAPPGLA